MNMIPDATAEALIDVRPFVSKARRDTDTLLRDTHHKTVFAAPFIWTNPAEIPPRDWLYGRTYIRKFLTATIAPGGVGKTTLSIVEALAKASGRSLLWDRVHGDKPLRVWLWNGEDPMDELQRRVGAAMLHYRITPDDLGDRLFLTSGRQMPINLAHSADKGPGIVLNLDVISDIKATILANRIDVMSVDPFVSCHSVPENDNGAIDRVVKEAWGDIAEHTNSAIGLYHHSRKSQGGMQTSVEDSRGASALVNAARFARVLNPMSEAEAKQAGITEGGARFRYFRSDDGKANLAPRADKAIWFEMASVDLGNATEDRPSDQVGVATKWSMPGLFDTVTIDDLFAVQNRLADKPWKKSPQANDWVGFLVADVLGLDASDESEKFKIKGLLRQWEKSGAIKVQDIKDEHRKVKPCYVAGVWANA